MLNLKFSKLVLCELTNIPLQIHIAKKKFPTIISTGMSTMKEVKNYRNSKKIQQKYCNNAMYIILSLFTKNLRYRCNTRIY